MIGPHAGEKAPPPRLITLAISPFNEYARWSLEYAGIPYSEKRQPLVVHAFASRRAGGKGTTPVLVTPAGTIGESTEIAEWASAQAPPGRRLYPVEAPGEEVRELVGRFASELAPACRRFAWSHLINDLDLACRYWAQGLTVTQARVQRVATRLAKRQIRQVMRLGSNEPAASLEIVRSYFDEVASRLKDEGRISGGTFTAADVAFAAMSAPALLPGEGPPVRLPSPDELPASVASVVAELREHPAGRYALETYRSERTAARIADG